MVHVVAHTSNQMMMMTDVMNETMKNMRTIHMSEFVSVENHLTQSTLLFFRDGLIVAEAVEGRQQLCA